jgi:hypothetical protein
LFFIILLCVLSSRVSKTYFKKSNKHAALANLIKQRGIVSETMSCFCCFKSNRVYCFAPELSRCRECVYAGKLCNRNTVAASYRYFPTSLLVLADFFS